MGPAVPIRLGTAYHFASDRRYLTHTEDQEADEVCCGVAFGPFEIDMRQSVSAVTHAHSKAASAFGTVELLRVRTR